MSVDFFFGRDMHTYAPEYGDPDVWVLPEGAEIDDNKLYCIEYDVYYPSDPSDMSSHTVVHRIKEVPEDVLRAIEESKRCKAIIDNYKRNF